MPKELTYRFYMDSGVPYIESNLISNGLDMLKIVSADLGNEQMVDKCINHIHFKKTWWFNSSKLKFNDSQVIIHPAFDWEAKAEISKDSLLIILEEFKKFIIKNIE